MMNISKSLVLFNPAHTSKLFTNNVRSIFLLHSCYAKPKAPPTEAELKVQKYKSELGLKRKSSIRDTPYTFQDVSTSIEYMDSEAFKLAYGDEPVWIKYVRNYGGHMKPKWTRLMCIRAGKYGTGSPCPICRDEFLVVSYKNLKLLKQFISNNTGELIPAHVTNVCQKTQLNLRVAYAKAVDYGLIERNVPYVNYDYALYYDSYKRKVETPSILLNIVTAAKLKDTNKVLTELTDNDILNINKS